MRDVAGRCSRLAFWRSRPGERAAFDRGTARAGGRPGEGGPRERGRYAVVQANVAGRDLVGFVEEAKASGGREGEAPRRLPLTWGGQFENQQRAAARLLLVVPVALGLIFLLLFATFGSVRQAAWSS